MCAKIARMATSRVKNNPPPLWIGGWVQSPTWAFDPEPYRPALVLWVRGDEVLASATAHPSERAEALAKCLRDAMKKTKQRPASVRVRDAAAAALVREALGDVPVRVGKTPEVDAAADARMTPPSDGSEDSYLSGGRLEPALVGTFFSAAVPLFRAAPWSVVPDDSVVFAFDAPSLGVEDAAVVVVGQRGVARGVLMFESVEAYLAFQRAAMSEDNDGSDHGAALFAISFADTLSTQRASEIAAHGWELVAPGLVAVGVPVLERFERDGLQRPIVARDLLVAVALCRALTRMVIEHGPRLAASAGPKVVSTFPTQHRGNAAVSRITLPHPDASTFDAAMAPHREVSVLLRDFLASEVRGRIPGVWRDVAESVVHALLDEKFESSGPRLDRWPLRLVDDAMARALTMLEGPRAQGLAADAITRFFGWMCSTERLSAPLSQRLQERALGHLEAAAPTPDFDAPDAAPESHEPSDDGTVDGEVLPPGVAEWARAAIRDAKATGA